jgi:hypothetical protein
MLGIIERRLFAENDTSKLYYISIGLQGALAAFMFSSFFASVAYNWYVYYLVAYAVCLRRIYQTEYSVNPSSQPVSSSLPRRPLIYQD